MGIMRTPGSHCLTVSAAAGHPKLQWGLPSLHQRALLHEHCQLQPGVLTQTRPEQDLLWAGVASQRTTLSRSHVEVAWGLQEVSHQREFGERFCMRLWFGPSSNLSFPVLRLSSLVGLMFLRKPRRMVQKTKGFKSFCAGSDESCLCVESFR